MSWNVWFLLLIGFSTSVDFWAARLIDRLPDERTKQRKLLLVLSITINLSLLAYFKYANFFIDNFVVLLQQLGFHTHKLVLELILPLGISFYTFEAISYVVDVYKKKIRSCESMLDYAVFIMFFPHLIAGPIVRAKDFLPQLSRQKRLRATDLRIGTQLLILGLFKKVLVADYLAQVADPVFAEPLAYSSTALWIAAFAYTGQIFCDFSGYSDMALGIARLLGFRLQANFNLPYLASDVSDFWRRWHISLSNWIRDYVYIPLGGKSESKTRTYSNLFATMVLCGFWHGANWQFLLWGAYHGILLVINNVLKNFGFCLKEKYRTISMLLTFLLVVFGWVIFRSKNLQTAGQYLSKMLVLHESASLSPYLLYCAVFGLSLLVLGHAFSGSFRGAKVLRLNPVINAVVLSFTILMITVLRPEQRTQFIYFQF